MQMRCALLVRSRGVPLLLVAVGAALWAADIRLPVMRPICVAGSPGWWRGQFRSGLGVQWVSDRELLHSRFGGPRPDVRAVYRRDVVTGREWLVPGLTRALDGATVGAIDGTRVSPDGRWLARPKGWDKCLLLDVSGRHRYTYPGYGDTLWGRIFWMADSRHWIEGFQANGWMHRLLLHDVAKPDLSQPIPVGDQGELFANLERVLSFDRAIALVPLDNDRGLAPESVAVYELSLDARKKAREVATIPVPRGSPEFGAELSAAGDRIAWVVAASRPHARRRAEVWVCDIDGSRMRCVAEMFLAETDPDLPQVEWLPSGHGLALQWDEWVYTICVGR